VTGLHTLWTSGKIDLILFSAALSLFSLTHGHVKHITSEKNNFLPIAGKLLHTAFAILSILARILAVLLFFAPSLGLANLLMHWKMGLLTLHTVDEFEEFDEFDEFEKIDVVEDIDVLDEFDKFEEIEIFEDDIDKLGPSNQNLVFDVQNGTEIYFKDVWIETPKYTSYTLWELETYYIIFLGLVLFHLGLVFGLKQLLAFGFR
jgi:hypothetical protein